MRQHELFRSVPSDLLCMSEDKATLLPKLLDIPSVKKKGAVPTAAALLRTVPLTGNGTTHASMAVQYC